MTYGNVRDADETNLTPVEIDKTLGERGEGGRGRDENRRNYCREDEG